MAAGPGAERGAGELTGVLLVGGGSRRFGSPKALARFGAETLAERAWRLLGEVCAERVAVGKAAEAGGLPFPVLDDGTGVRAPLAGLVAGLRATRTDVAVVIPVDCPLLAPADLRALAAACADAAVPPTGPLPGAYRTTALPALARALADGRLAIRAALEALDVAVVELDPTHLANANTPEELRSLATAAAPAE
jgi:molybdopterin-guanine dinucleotide biosynthesis protein A